MKFATAFFALIPLVYALPAPDPEVMPSLVVAAAPNLCRPQALASRAQGAVFVCANAPFAEPCSKFSGVSGECVNFPAAFSDDISSVGPDSGQDCFFFVQVFFRADAGCSGARLGPVRNPGIPDLFSTGFNDNISSFQYAIYTDQPKRSTTHWWTGASSGERNFLPRSRQRLKYEAES
ncbi:hypothetical protein FB451DRAFT_1178850 [Mycena latifolia]|nr:hypothetical protein FB451DRAFT_1178850 [Mycena latifolia]